MRTLDSDNAIVTAAVTGAIHTPSMSPHLPVTPEEIAAECLAAAEAGAAVVHVHVRDPETGEPVNDVSLFREVATQVRAESDVIIQTTTGGALGTSPEERIAVVPDLEPEMCSCNMGSINFGLYPMAAGRDDWKYDWEPEYLASTTEHVFQNTFGDLETILGTIAEHETVPSLECYDTGHLYNLAHCVEQGWIEPPLHIEFVMGIHGGIGASAANLVHMKRVADELFGEEYSLSVIGAGSNQFPLVTQGLSMGAQPRVGLEDNLYLERGRLAESNTEGVKRIVDLAWQITGREPASPGEVRDFLGLKAPAETAI
jgi:uncharacterized protein (DUF849 family)